MKEREAGVFARELVGGMDSTVTVVAEGSFLGGAKNRGLLFVANVALDLHPLSLSLSLSNFSLWSIGFLVLCLVNLEVYKEADGAEVNGEGDEVSWAYGVGRC